uniref:Ankyrin repeat and BTB/POZ domain-containing protein BTBD11-like n=1 Tax=Callorhinchus milii TaxID=7868 RepID=A0A4W3I3L9_CALMI
MAALHKRTARNFEDLTLDSGYGGAANSFRSSNLSLSQSGTDVASGPGGRWWTLPGSGDGRHMASCDTLDTGLAEGSEGLEGPDYGPKLPHLEDIPWTEEEIQEVLTKCQIREANGNIPHELLKRLSTYLSRVLVRIAREAQRLSLMCAKCTKHEIQSAVKMVLSWSLSESCIGASVKALSLYNMSSGDQFNSSKSSQCGIVFSVGRFFRWMVDSKVSTRIHQHAAIYLAACMENLLEEVYLRLLENLSLQGKSMTEAIEKKLEQTISNDAELWGLFRPIEPLICGKNAYGVPCLPSYLSLYTDRYQANGSSQGPLYSHAELRTLEQSMLATCVGSIAELSDLVSHAMYYLQQFGAKCHGTGSQVHFRQGPYSWEPEALHSLYYYMHCPQMEWENPNIEPSRVKLATERPYEVLPPVVEWIRVCIVHTEHRHSVVVDSNDVRQAARLLLPGVDCEPRQLRADSCVCRSRRLNAKEAELKLRQDLGFQMLSCGRTDLVKPAAGLLGPEGTNTLNEQGMSPLMYACASGDEAMVQVLLDSGADIDIQVPSTAQQFTSVHAETRRWTALTFAVAFGHLAVTQLMLDAGAHVEGFVNEGSCSETPLQLAATAGHFELVNLLLEKGADPLAGVLGKSGVTASLQGISNPFSQAAAHGHRNVLRKLLSQPEVSNEDILSLEDILAEGADVSCPPTVKPGLSRSSKARRKALQDALYQSAEHEYLDITMELRNLSVPWTLHAWLKSLRTSFIQGRWSITQCLLKEFDGVKDVYCEDMISQGLPLMFDIFQQSQNDVIVRQMAAIFSHCYGPYPIPTIPEFGQKIKPAIDPSLLNNKEKSEITFLVEGKPFYGQRALLSAASSRFRGLISGAPSANTPASSPILVKDITYSTFEVCSSGQLGVSSIGKGERLSLLQVLSAASTFRLKALKRHCELICSKNMTLSNSVQVYQQSKIHKASELLSFCIGYFLKNMVPLLELDSFQQLLFGACKTTKGASILTELQAALACRMQAIYRPTSKETMV